MEIVSAGPLPVASVLWRPAPHAIALTFVARATFRLAPMESELADEQDAPVEEDTHWNDDPSRSLSAPSDLAPFKARADVILVGNAYAPRAEPVRSLVARLKVGEIDKSIEVFGDRTITQEGQLREGPRFVRVPLRWERAAGGPETHNPVGVRLDVEDAYGATALPNVQPTGLYVERRGQHVPPVGFGPIAPWWPARRELLGRHAATWPGARWMDHPLPSDVDPAFFNAAPRDQQLTTLRDDEPILLEHLHPDHPRLVTALPGVRPRARIERRGTQDEVPMIADTLWIDAARGICTVTWRGRVPLDHPGEPGRIVIALEAPQHRSPLRSTVRIDGSGRTMVEPPRPRPSSALPFVSGGPGEGAAAEATPIADPITGAEEDVTSTLSGWTKGEKRAALPFVPAPADGATAQRPALRGFPAGSRPTSPTAPPLFVSPSRPEPTPWSAAVTQERRPEPVAAPIAPSLATEAAPAPNAASGGVLAAPDAAAAARAAPVVEAQEQAAPPAAPRARSPREIVKLVWFDPAALPRIRKEPAWRKLLADLEMRLVLEAEADVAAGPMPADVKDRRTVLEVLVHGESISADGVRQAVEGAIREDGGFEPPVAIVGAELEMPFDELETLKATATVVRPMASTDKRLKEALDLVDPLLASAWLSGSGSVAESMTAKLREAFAQGKRAVSPDYLHAHAERMLLEQRAYQRRALFDKKWIRSVMRSVAGPIPAYLPEDMKDGLPMFRRFQARMLAELDLREDEGEASPWAVRVLALGRVIAQGA